MAEQDAHQHTADVKEGETKSINIDNSSVSNEYKQEETDSDLNVKHTEGSSSASANRETKNNNGEDMEQLDVIDGDSEGKTVPLTEASSSLDEASTLTVEENSTLPQADDRSHGDDNRVTPGNEQATGIESDLWGNEIHDRGEYHTGEKNALKTTTSPTQDDRQDDLVDGPNITDTEAGEDDGIDLDSEENATSPQMALPQEISDEEELDEQRSNVETIGPTTQEITEPAVPGSPGGTRRYLIAVGIVVAIAILMQHLLQTESPPQQEDVRHIDIFLRQVEKLKTQFPNQRAEVWTRSKIHLLRHLQTAQPTEPVSLILTAGVRAERTLLCMAQGLASAFSSALNASVLHIDGASKASQDSDQVKLDIDSKLQGAFEGDKPVAIIHRFEELPPGSTLIFYRYCDHENAAYKKTFLIFTVLLGEEEEIPAKSRLSTVEEMVDDHLQKKFLSEDHPVSFDRMDLDKYGGLWSRISHLILPVTSERRMEHEGCQGT